MCLTPRRKDRCNKPYKGQTTRWKVLESWPMDQTPLLRSELFGENVWKMGYWYKAKQKRVGAEACDIGFHVFVHRPTGHYVQSYQFVVEVEVKDFNTSGHWNGRQCETWRQARVVRVFDKYGNNISDQFKAKK